MITRQTIHETLMAIRSVYPDAIVAGGAIRDLITGKPIKDIDVWVEWRRGQTDEDIACALRAALGWPRHEILIPSAVTEYACVGDRFAQIRTVINFSMDGEDGVATPVQVVVLNRPVTMEAVLGRFDFGFCRAGYDGTDIITTSEFEADYGNHTMTVLRCGSREELRRSLHRYMRLVGKYRGYRLVFGAAALRYGRGLTP